MRALVRWSLRPAPGPHWKSEKNRAILLEQLAMTA
jgi:hypothetical protein